MSILIPGNSPVNAYQFETGVSGYGSGLDGAVYIHTFRIIDIAGGSSTTLGITHSGAANGLELSYSSNLDSVLFSWNITNVVVDDIELIPNVAESEWYTVVINPNFVTGELKAWVNGVEAITPIDITGEAFGSSLAIRPFIYGPSATGSSVEHLEQIVIFGNVPEAKLSGYISGSDIQSDIDFDGVELIARPAGTGYSAIFAADLPTGNYEHNSGPSTGDFAPQLVTAVSLLYGVDSPTLYTVSSVTDGQADLAAIPETTIISVEVLTTAGVEIIAAADYAVDASNQITIESELLESYDGQDVDLIMTYGQELAQARVTVTSWEDV